MGSRITKIKKRDGSTVDFDQEKITVAIYKAGASLGIHDRKSSEQLSDEVVEILHQEFGGKNLPTVEKTQDIVEETLIRNDKAKIAKAYILYRNQRAKRRELEKDSVGTKFQDCIPYKKIWQVLVWNLKHECETIDKLNHHIKNNTIKDLILEAEKAYDADVARAAQTVIERKADVRLVIIAGPSCSGKTTTTIKLGEHLKKEGMELVALNIDNYFFNIECQPVDQFGDYDFETPEALDLNLIDYHISELLAGKKVMLPRYDFKTGQRKLDQDPMQIKDNQIVLIDTLHGLYEPMTKNITQKQKFKLYIETLSQLKDNDGNFTRWTDIRLMRRMIRDMSHRNYQPDKTIEHWHYVRRSELKHIIPYNPNVDYIVNGSLCFELPVLKKYLYNYFPKFVENYRDDEHRQDAFVRAQRILKLLDSLETLEDDSIIPGNSLMREFIGGSTYKY